MDLKALGLSARRYVQGLEETIINTLANFDVKGFSQPKKVGVWTSATDKIASIGVRIQRRVTSHGFSLNVDLQMNPCELIVSCGMPDARMVSLNQLVPQPGDMWRLFGTRSRVPLPTCSRSTLRLDRWNRYWRDASHGIFLK